MLLVKTRVAPSPIHGLGLYAAQDIPRGTPVWRFTPGFDLDTSAADLDKLPEAQRQILLHYGYVDARLQRYILCCDDTRFINHSSTPNLAARRDVDPHGIDHAVRDISAGEELTLDYGLLEADSSSQEIIA